MIDFVSNAILSKVAHTLEKHTGANITFRESPDFNFSKEMKSAISSKTIFQNIAGNKQALLLAIYNVKDSRISEKGSRHRIRKMERFKSGESQYHGVEKRFVTMDWTIQLRVSCSIKDVAEAIMLNYLYWVKHISNTSVVINMDDIEPQIQLNYTTDFSDTTGLDYAEYGSYGSMYILSFDINVTGDIFLPQAILYPKIKEIVTSYTVGMDGDATTFLVERKVIRK